MAKKPITKKVVAKKTAVKKPVTKEVVTKTDVKAVVKPTTEKSGNVFWIVVGIIVAIVAIAAAQQ